MPATTPSRRAGAGGPESGTVNAATPRSAHAAIHHRLPVSCVARVSAERVTVETRENAVWGPMSVDESTWYGGDRRQQPGHRRNREPQRPGRLRCQNEREESRCQAGQHAQNERAGAEKPLITDPGVEHRGHRIQGDRRVIVAQPGCVVGVPVALERAGPAGAPVLVEHRGGERVS